VIYNIVIIHIRNSYKLKGLNSLIMFTKVEMLILVNTNEDNISNE